MYISGQRFTPVEGATKVPATCSNCNNAVEFQLHSSKVGPGLSIPITPLFTDKFTLAYKAYFLICPICSAMDKISRDQANGLGA